MRVAVLANIQEAGGVDSYWILGDLVAMGHDPVGVMERLAALPNATFIRGGERYITSFMEGRMRSRWLTKWLAEQDAAR
jgi:hypothetical protein